MVYWAPFLHFYQPPIQFHAILKKVCNESYRPLLEMLKAHAHAKVTINICGTLTELLNEHGATDVLASIRKLADNGQLEFVDSAKYHAILPLISEKEMRRQIELNYKTNSYFFKDAYKPSGFFPPEMCYSASLAEVLSQMGYKWVLISGIACAEEWPRKVIYKLPVGSAGIYLFYRDDILSNKISFHNIDSSGFIRELSGLGSNREDVYVITAMDAETFGHHIHNWEKLFLAEVYEIIDGVARHENLTQRINLAEEHKKILESKDISRIEVVTISQLLNKFPAQNSRPPKPSSWSTTGEDIQKKNYYPLWKDRNNPVHNLQWEHIEICLELVNAASELKDNEQNKSFYEIARGLLDRAIHSCQFWWANRERGMWDINLIHKGLIIQEEVILNVYKSIKLSYAPEKLKRRLYHKVLVAREITSKIRDQLILS